MDTIEVPTVKDPLEVPPLASVCSELLYVLLHCEAPPALKHRAVDAVQAARAALATPTGLALPAAIVDALWTARTLIKTYRHELVDSCTDPKTGEMDAEDRGLLQPDDNALAKIEQVLVDCPELRPIPWPTTPADVRAFIGPHFGSLDWGSPADGKPHENDRYALSAHDLLSAFRDCADTAAQIEVAGTTEPQR